MRAYRPMVLCLFVVAGLGLSPATVQAQQESKPRVQRAVRFLDSVKRSRYILGYLHFGGTYQDYDILSVLKVVDRDGDVIPGHFALKVVYDWKTSFGDNSTTSIFFFDEKGTIYDIRADTTSIISQPFVLADATIQVLGNALLQAFGDQMSQDDRKQLQKIVDAADAKALMIWGLNFQMRTGL